MSNKATRHPAMSARCRGMMGGEKKAIKISVTLCSPVHDTDDLGGFKMCHGNFNMRCKARVDDRYTTYFLLSFPVLRQLSSYLSRE